MRKVPRERDRRRVGRAAATLGLAPLLDRRPRQLSGGQRQRVALGRAIVREPAVFLFDEPSVEPRRQAPASRCGPRSRALQRRLETTTVYVTHDQVEAMTMGERIAVMKGGRLQQVGTPLEIYDRPANLFVANFIGSPTMNLLSVRSTADGGGLAAGDSRLALPAGLPASSRAALGPPGRALVLGFRPEAASLAFDAVPAAPGEPPATLQVEVEFLEHLGHETLVHARHAAERVTVKVVPRLAPAVGETVLLALDPGALHLFDPETSLRIPA